MSEQEINMIIAENLTRFMDIKGKSQAQLADFMNVSQATVSNWCKGLKMPRMDKIDKICEFFHCTRSDLMQDKAADKTASSMLSVYEDPQLAELVSVLTAMSVEERKQVLEYAKFIASRS